MHRRTIFRSELLSDKYDYVLNYMKRLAGGENVGFNNSVFLSGCLALKHLLEKIIIA